MKFIETQAFKAYKILRDQAERDLQRGQLKQASERLHGAIAQLESVTSFQNDNEHFLQQYSIAATLTGIVKLAPYLPKEAAQLEQTLFRIKAITQILLNNKAPKESTDELSSLTSFALFPNQREHPELSKAVAHFTAGRLRDTRRLLLETEPSASTTPTQSESRLILGTHIARGIFLALSVLFFVVNRDSTGRFVRVDDNFKSMALIGSLFSLALLSMTFMPERHTPVSKNAAFAISILIKMAESHERHLQENLLLHDSIKWCLDRITDIEKKANSTEYCLNKADYIRFCHINERHIETKTLVFPEHGNNTIQDCKAILSSLNSNNIPSALLIKSENRIQSMTSPHQLYPYHLLIIQSCKIINDVPLKYKNSLFTVVKTQLITPYITHALRLASDQINKIKRPKKPFNRFTCENQLLAIIDSLAILLIQYHQTAYTVAQLVSTNDDIALSHYEAWKESFDQFKAFCNTNDIPNETFTALNQLEEATIESITLILSHKAELEARKAKSRAIADSILNQLIDDELKIVAANAHRRAESLAVTSSIVNGIVNGTLTIESQKEKEAMTKQLANDLLDNLINMALTETFAKEISTKIFFTLVDQLLIDAAIVIALKARRAEIEATVAPILSKTIDGAAAQAEVVTPILDQLIDETVNQSDFEHSRDFFTENNVPILISDDILALLKFLNIGNSAAYLTGPYLRAAHLNFDLTAQEIRIVVFQPAFMKKREHPNAVQHLAKFLMDSRFVIHKITHGRHPIIVMKHPCRNLIIDCTWHDIRSEEGLRALSEGCDVMQHAIYFANRKLIIYFRAAHDYHHSLVCAGRSIEEDPKQIFTLINFAAETDGQFEKATACQLANHARLFSQIDARTQNYLWHQTFFNGHGLQALQHIYAIRNREDHASLFKAFFPNIGTFNQEQYYYFLMQQLILAQTRTPGIFPFPPSTTNQSLGRR